MVGVFFDFASPSIKQKGRERRRRGNIGGRKFEGEVLEQDGAKTGGGLASDPWDTRILMGATTAYGISTWGEGYATDSRTCLMQDPCGRKEGGEMKDGAKKDV
jgi:hypothetical protein